VHNAQVANSPTNLLLTRVFSFSQLVRRVMRLRNMSRWTEASYLHYVVNVISY
jgi:hypothetical protein